MWNEKGSTRGSTTSEGREGTEVQKEIEEYVAEEDTTNGIGWGENCQFGVDSKCAFDGTWNAQIIKSDKVNGG